MYLILLFVVFGLIGFWLAASRFSGPIDRTAGAVVDRPRSWYARIRGRGRKSLPAGETAHPFIAWASREGARYFPEEFTDWLGSLAQDEAGTFVAAMQDYAQGLGFQLDDLTRESLQARPALMQVYVEALTVYSQAYRRAKQANQAAEKSGEEASGRPSKGPKTNGKKDGKTEREAVNSAETALTPAS